MARAKRPLVRFIGAFSALKEGKFFAELPLTINRQLVGRPRYGTFDGAAAHSAPRAAQISHETVRARFRRSENVPVATNREAIELNRGAAGYRTFMRTADRPRGLRPIEYR